MTLSGIETHHSPPSQISSPSDRREVAPARASHDTTDRAREQSESRGASSSQDQVTLSKEAQTRSVSDSQPLKNSTFEQSPFDK